MFHVKHRPLDESVTGRKVWGSRCGQSCGLLGETEAEGGNKAQAVDIGFVATWCPIQRGGRRWLGPGVRLE